MNDGTPRYFAVPDPDTGDMTYWFRTYQGQIKAWPRTPPARYGPTLYRHMMPVHIEGPARNQWVRDWTANVRTPWMRHILDAIEQDPATAAARFAALRTKCFICGLPLEDDDSKVWGVGPVCRPKVPAAFLQAAAREIGRAHAELLQQS